MAAAALAQTGVQGLSGTIGGNVVTTGFWQQTGIAAPPVSATGSGRIYFDTTAGRFQVSENGGAYGNLVGAGGGTVTGTGTTNTIAKWTSSTAIGNSSLTDSGTALTSTASSLTLGANPATAGALRLSNGSGNELQARNAVNTANINLIALGSDDNIYVGNTPTVRIVTAARALEVGNAPVAGSGTLRLPNGCGALTQRNAQNSADVQVACLDGSNIVQLYGGTVTLSSAGNLTSTGTMTEGSNRVAVRALTFVPVSAFFTGTVLGSTVYGRWTPDVAITLKRINVSCVAAGSGQTNGTQFQMTDGTTASTVTLINVTNNTATFTQNYAAGTILLIQSGTTDGTAPQNCNVVATFIYQ